MSLPALFLPLFHPPSLLPIRSTPHGAHGTHGLRSHPSIPGKTAVDRAAANRFIKHAIAQAKGQPQPRTPGEAPAQSDGARPSAHTHIRFDENGNAPSGPSSSASSSTPATQIPVKVTSKMLARAEYQKKLAEEDASSNDDDDGDGLDVIDGESEDDPEPEPVISKARGKGKAKATSEEAATPSDSKKRRRPVPDPFAGSY